MKNPMKSDICTLCSPLTNSQAFWSLSLSLDCSSTLRRPFLVPMPLASSCVVVYIRAGVAGASIHVHPALALRPRELSRLPYRGCVSLSATHKVWEAHTHTNDAQEPHDHSSVATSRHGAKSLVGHFCDHKEGTKRARLGGIKPNSYSGLPESGPWAINRSEGTNISLRLQ